MAIDSDPEFNEIAPSAGKSRRTAFTWWADDGVESCSMVCASLVSVGMLVRDAYPAWFRGITAILVLFTASAAIWEYFKIRKRETISELKAKIQELRTSCDNQALALEQGASSLVTSCEGILSTLANELNFSNADRITLYLYQQDEDCFTPLARVASNPNIQKLGRKIHSSNIGCLGKAWEKGHDICSAPKWVTTGTGALKETEWVRWCEQLGFSPEEATKIRFRALDYFGWRVQHGNFDRKLAILMLESSDRDRWNEKALLEFLESNGERQSRLLELVNNISANFPNAQVAKRRGM